MTEEEPERRSSHVQLLPVEKTRSRLRSKQSESDDQGVHYNTTMEEMSLYTTPFLHSVSSTVHDHQSVDRAKQKVLFCVMSKF